MFVGGWFWDGWVVVEVWCLGLRGVVVCLGSVGVGWVVGCCWGVGGW